MIQYLVPELQPEINTSTPVLPQMEAPGQPLQFLVRQPLQSTMALVFGLLDSFSGFLLTVGIGEFFVLHYGSTGAKGKLLHTLGIHLSSEKLFFSIMVMLVLLKSAAGYFAKRNRQVLTEKWAQGWREFLFSRQLSMTAEAFHEKPYGQYLLRYSNDMKAIQQYLGKGVIGATNDLLFLFTGVVVLSWYSPVIAGMVLLGLLSGLVLVSLLMSRQTAVVRQSRSERSRMLAFVTRTFSRFRKISERGDRYTYWKGFTERSGTLYTANLRQQNKLAGVEALNPLFQYGLVIGILAVAAAGWIQLPSGDLLVVMMILMLMQGAIRRLLLVPGTIMKGLLSIRKIRE